MSEPSPVRAAKAAFFAMLFIAVCLGLFFAGLLGMIWLFGKVGFILWYLLFFFGVFWFVAMLDESRRDTDGSPEGGDACGSVRSTTAGAEGIAQTGDA